jgi:hypothetical protein
MAGMIHFFPRSGEKRGMTNDDDLPGVLRGRGGKSGSNGGGGGGVWAGMENGTTDGERTTPPTPTPIPS